MNDEMLRPGGALPASDHRGGLRRLYQFTKSLKGVVADLLKRAADTPLPPSIVLRAGVDATRGIGPSVSNLAVLSGERTGFTMFCSAL